MTKLLMVEATREHIADVASFMRQADIDEIKAATGSTPEQALDYSFRMSDFCFAGCVAGRAIGMYGVGTINVLNNTGAPWLLGTEEILQHKISFLRQSKQHLMQLSGQYIELKNMVDDRNTLSKLWLKWLGFTLSEPVIAGLEQRPFRHFSMRFD